jgi:hypothetical protein
MSEDKVTPIQKLAQRLHDHLCGVRGTEMCGWYRIDKPWSQGSNYYHNEVYLHTAERLLSVCNGDFELAGRIIEALWPTLKLMK